MKETTLNFLNSACSNMYSCGVLAIAYRKPLEDRLLRRSPQQSWTVADLAHQIPRFLSDGLGLPKVRIGKITLKNFLFFTKTSFINSLHHFPKRLVAIGTWMLIAKVPSLPFASRVNNFGI